ncbi:MAG TPA: hypothetical protein VJ464_25780 [Blastocatellia bacterium]|nr:hypothetical protein [Blastocatellia bacterium]
MNDIPDFQEALALFRSFLADQRHPDKVIWVFREDVWKRSPTQVFIKYPPPQENASLIQKVFSEGRQRGLIDITAVAATYDKVVASVWFPKYPEEEVQDWDRGMKLSIIQPLPYPKLLPPWMWRLIQLLPQYQQYQKGAGFIGTRPWAAA